MFAELKDKGERARQASRQMATLNTAVKNKALKAIAEALMEQEPAILSANDHDVDAGQEAGLSEALLDRLLLTVHRLEAIANDVLAVAALPDPVGEMFEARILPNSLRIAKRRVPVGVIGVI